MTEINYEKTTKQMEQGDGCAFKATFDALSPTERTAALRIIEKTNAKNRTTDSSLPVLEVENIEKDVSIYTNLWRNTSRWGLGRSVIRQRVELRDGKITDDETSCANLRFKPY